VYAEIEAIGHLAPLDAIRLEIYLKRIDKARHNPAIFSHYTQNDGKILISVNGFEIVGKESYKRCIRILDNIIALLKAA
jgi:hypothetical protein